MNVTREVILDLLPVYLAGEASPATRELVEEYLKQDPELARRIRPQWAEGLDRVAPSALPPELELRSLRRTRRVLGLLRWLFALAIVFTAIGLALEISFEGGGVREFHFLVQDYPAPFGACLLVGTGCWIAYVALRRRLRARPS
jgi:hypothetical protein